MKLTDKVQQGFRQFALVGILCTPLIAASSMAVELTGKPTTLSSPHKASSMSMSSMSSSMDHGSMPGMEDPHKAPPPPEAPSVGTAPEPMDPPEPWDDSDQAEEQIEQAMQHVGPALDKAFGHHGENLGALLLIPLFAIAFVFGGPVILIIVLVILRYRAKERRQQHINANIDKLLAAGRDIPVELLRGDDTVVNKDDGNLHKGMRNIGLGVGWLIFLTILCGIEIGAIGFIFIGLGISQMVVWKLSSPKTDNNQAQG